MDIQTLTREFRYNGVKLADPNPAFSLQQVRDFYANVYPEITSADIEGPEQVGTATIYTFRRAVGTKGNCGAEHLVHDLRAALQANWLDPHDAEFVKEMDQLLCDKDLDAISADDLQRLAHLHAEYCTSKAA